MPACELFKEGTEKAGQIQKRKAGGSSRAQRAGGKGPVINSSSCVFPSPTRHWPGMTQPLTGKVLSSWKRAQGCGKLAVLQADTPDFSPDSSIAGFMALDTSFPSQKMPSSLGCFDDQNEYVNQVPSAVPGTCQLLQKCQCSCSGSCPNPTQGLFEEGGANSPSAKASLAPRPWMAQWPIILLEITTTLSCLKAEKELAL